MEREITDTRPVTTVDNTKFYRDGQGILWMDPERVPDTSNWYLYRGGLGCREYTFDGKFICEWGADGKRGEPQEIPLYNLVVEIDKTPTEEPPQPHEEDVQASFIKGEL